MGLNEFREFVLFVAGACERAITVMRNHGYRFERFPRNRIANPPTTDAERWECLAFSLYTDIAELASKADQLLESDVIYEYEQRLDELQTAYDKLTGEVLSDRVHVVLKSRAEHAEKDNCELRTALAALVRKTEECDNPRDEGVSDTDDVMVQARRALGIGVGS